jgi:uncharacterized protein (DUF2147 family)
MRINATALKAAAAIAAALLSAGAARAESTPIGIWIDHTGRGAVEITDCGGKLCGHVAWVKDAKDADGCGAQIIGDVRPVSGNTWDNGWIYDPDRGEKFDVEIKTISADKLRVTGYAGIKWLSETMTWKRAPADLQKCAKPGEAASAPAGTTPAAAKAASAPAETTPAAAKALAAAAVAAPAQPKKAEAAAPAAEKKAATEAAAKKADDEAADDEDVTANAEDDEEADGDGGKRPGAFVAKLAEALEGSKVERRGNGTCRMEVPYVDMVVSFPCKDKD